MITKIMNNLIKDPLFQFILEGNYTYKVSNTEYKRPPNVTRVFGESALRNLFKNAEREANALPRRSKLNLFCCMGEDMDGRAVVKDFSFEIRRLLITGVQGSGKSNASTCILFSILWGNDPETTELHIFDAKGEFQLFSKVANVYSDYKRIGENIKKLREVMEERNATIRKLNHLGIRNLAQWNLLRKGQKQPLIPRIVLFIDEYATTSANVKNMNEDLLVITNTGRSAGIYIIIVTQRADRDMLPPAIKANMTSDLAFWQRDDVNARISGIENASKIRTTGVAYFRLGLDATLVKFPYVSDQILVNSINNLASLRR